MITRRIALITAILLIIMSGSVFANLPDAVQPENVIDTAYNEAITLLSALQVNSLSSPEKAVNYNSFYDALSYTLSDDGSSYDISQLTGIHFSTASGSINLTYDDAVRSLVNLLGYKVKVDDLNGSMSAYFTVANRIGLLDDVEKPDDGKMKARDTAVLIKNALDIEPLQQTSIGVNPQYKAIDGETLLYVYRRIKNDFGIVTANEFTSITSNDGVAKSSVKINDKVFKDNSGIAESLVGYNVKYYYFTDSQKAEIITAIPFDNEIISIDGNYEGRTGRKIFYLDASGKEKNCIIPGNVSFIYNGVALTHYDEDMLDFSDKKAEIIDNNTDGKADVVIVKESVEILVEGTDTTLMTIHDGIGNRVIDVSEFGPYERVRFFENDGSESYFYSVAAGDVLSVYISKDNTLFDAYICKEKIEGKLTTKKPDDIYGEIVTIGGNDYRLTKAFAEREKDNLTLGSIGTFYLSIDGKIAYAKYTDTQLMYGYIIKATDGGAFGSDAFINMLKADGDVESMQFNNQIKIDGKRYNSVSTAYAALNNAIANSGTGVCRYDISEDGKVYYIDTAYHSANEGDNTLFSFGPMSEDTYALGTTLFPKKFWLDPNNTILFFAPKDPALQSEEHFGVGSPSRLKGGSTSYWVQGFGTDKDNHVPEVVVCNKDYIEAWEVEKISPSLIVKSVEMMMNDEEEVTYKIVYYQKTTLKEAFCRDVSVMEGLSLEEGDVIAAVTDNKGEIAHIVKLYDEDTHTLDLSYYDNKGITTTNFNSYCFQYSGYVYFCDGTIVGVSKEHPSTITGMGYGKVQYFKLNNSLGTVLNYSYPEDDERRLRPVSGSEIKDYIKYGEDCARIYIKVDNAAAVAMSVYQR